MIQFKILIFLLPLIRCRNFRLERRDWLASMEPARSLPHCFSKIGQERQDKQWRYAPLSWIPTVREGTTVPLGKVSDHDEAGIRRLEFGAFPALLTFPFFVRLKS